MKKLLLACLLLAGLQSASQQSTVRGIVSIHNSETQTGKRQYVTNAQVEDDFGKATPRVTDDKGQFGLVYVGVAEKAGVSFQVRKSGLQVVDLTALSAVAGQQDLVKISMAYPDSIAEYRRRIFKVGKTEAEKRLESLVQHKNMELADFRKNVAQNAEKIKKAESDLASLEEQRKKITEQAEGLARKYAPLNLDDASSLFRDAFVLFQNGQFDDAYTLLQQANLSGRVDSILLERNKIAQVKNEIQIRDSIAKQRTKDAGEALRLKGDLHKTRYEFDSVSYCYELLIKLDSSNGRYFYLYSDYLSWLNQFDKAIVYGIKALDIFRQSAGNNQTATGWVAGALNNLGTLYRYKNDYSKAVNTLEEALSINRQLAKENPQKYDLQEAITQDNLGNVYRKMHEYNKAESAILETVRIRRRLAAENPPEYTVELAKALNSLGVLYWEKNDFSKAEATLLESLEIKRKLAKENPPLNTPILANVLNALGNLYLDMKNYTKAEKMLIESVQICKLLCVDNPQTYEPDLANSQRSLGNLYDEIYEFRKAEPALVESLEIYKRLAIDNPQTYKVQVAITQLDLGVLYFDKIDLTSSEASYLQALEIYKQLARDNPGIYESKLSAIQNNLGNLYARKKDFQKAEAAHSEALRIRRQLAITYPKKYDPEIARSLCNLGELYRLSKEYTKSEAAYMEALKIRRQSAIDNPGAYEPELASTLSNFGNFYSTTKEYTKAKVILTESLEMYERLVKNGNVYEWQKCRVMNDLGLVYKNSKDYQKAETIFLTALEILKPHAKTNPQLYDHYSYVLQENLGLVYKEAGDYLKAEQTLQKVHATVSQLAGENPEVFEPALAELQNELGLLYLQIRHWEESETYLLKSVGMLEKWYANRSGNDKEDLNKTAGNLIDLYLAMPDSLICSAAGSSGKKGFNAMEEKLTNLAKSDSGVARKLSDFYSRQSKYLLITGMVSEAKRAAEKGIETDPHNTGVKINLAHIMLFQHNYEEALKLYQQIKPLKNEAGRSYAEICLKELDELAKKGITSKEVESIKTFLKK